MAQAPGIAIAKLLCDAEQDRLLCDRSGHHPSIREEQLQQGEGRACPQDQSVRVTEHWRTLL